MNFLIICLINLLLLDCVYPFKINRFRPFRSSLNNKFSTEFRIVPTIKERINDKFIRFSDQPGRPESLEPRILLDFIADPSIFVTMLSLLEQMYLTVPFGFLLKPVVNFFRVPNRRRKRSMESSVLNQIQKFKFQIHHHHHHQLKNV